MWFLMWLVAIQFSKKQITREQEEKLIAGMVSNGFWSQQASAGLYRKDADIMLSSSLQNQSKRTPRKTAIMNFMTHTVCLEWIWVLEPFFFKKSKMKTHVFQKEVWEGMPTDASCCWECISPKFYFIPIVLTFFLHSWFKESRFWHFSGITRNFIQFEQQVFYDVGRKKNCLFQPNYKT